MEIRKISTENFGGMADKHYDVIKFKDLCKLPVGNIAADDCFLFL